MFNFLQKVEINDFIVTNTGLVFRVENVLKSQVICSKGYFEIINFNPTWVPKPDPIILKKSIVKKITLEEAYDKLKQNLRK